MLSQNYVLGVPASPSPADVFAAMADGDDDAWRMTVARYRGLLLGVALDYRLTPDEAADVMQEVWARLLEHIADIRDPAAIAGWLRTTASRQCLAIRRWQWRESPVADAGNDVAFVWDADALLDASARRAALHRAVRGLPGRERALIEALLHPTPLSYAEISRRLSMPIGSIGPIRARALRRLRAALARTCGPAEPVDAPLTA